MNREPCDCDCGPALPDCGGTFEITITTYERLPDGTQLPAKVIENDGEVRDLRADN